MPNNLLKGKPLLFGLAAVSLTAGKLYEYEHNAHRYPHNLNAALAYYGFTEPERKQALRYLMQRSGVKDTDSLLDRKAENQAALSRLILDLARETQDKFTMRTDNQERWDVQTSDWMKDPEQQSKMLSALETLKMVNAVHPIFKNSDVLIDTIKRSLLRPTA